jgi:hypothetical protein
MTKSQENKLSAYEAVDTCLSLDENQPIWTSLEPFVDLVTQFRMCKGRIYEIAIAQNHIITGTTKDKSEVRTALEEAIIKVINAVVAYAISITDTNLEETISYSVRQIRVSRDTGLVEIAANVYNIAFPLRQHLPTFYVTEADVVLVQTLADNFRQQVGIPRHEKVIIKGATYNLMQEFAQADEILNKKIDKMILVFRPAHPNFVKKYFDAREIINLGIRHSGPVGRLTGTVYKAGTQVPLSNATIRVPGKNRQTKTDDNGNYVLVFRKKTTITLQVTLEGYQTYPSAEITIKPGDQINLKIELEPIEI